MTMKPGKGLIAITGAYGGLGKATAFKMAESGENLVLGGRDLEKLESLASRIRSTYQVDVHVKQIDVTSEISVSNFFSSTKAPLSGLVHTAAEIGSAGTLLETDMSSWQRTIEVNLFGTALVLKYAAQKILDSSGTGNLVVLSGGGASGPLKNLSAYAASKVAVVRLVETFAREIGKAKVGIYAVAPGILNTEMNRNLVNRDATHLDPEYTSKIREALARGGDSIEVAVELIGFLLDNQDMRLSGRLISAQWDEWKSWRPLPELFDSSDLFTLRRTVPDSK